MRGSSYCYECLLIEALEKTDVPMYKKAFDLGGIASDVEASVKGQIDTSSPGGMAESVAKFLVPGVLFKISPVLGILDVAASFVGLDIVSLFDRFIQFIKPKIQSGEMIDASSISQLGRSIGSAMGGGGDDDADEANDRTYAFHHLLNEIKKNSWGSSSPSPTIPFFGGESSSWLGRVFGNLFKMQAKGKARWLIVGFVTWLVKTVLLSAGLLAVGGAVKSLVMPNHPSVKEMSPPSPYAPTEHPGATENAAYKETVPNKTNVPDKALPIWKEPSGRGEEMHVNDGATSIWVVPIVDGSVEGTLATWVKDVYPSFDQQLNNPSFYRMVDQLRRANNYAPAAQMAVPQQYKSRKQVVDAIVKDIQ